MIIKNTTRKNTLSSKARYAKSFKDKTFGLIFDKKDRALVITTRFGVHTHLMNQAIDILILDKQNRIVRIRENLSPNRIFVWNPKYSKVLELPRGSVKKSHSRVGDKIVFDLKIHKLV